MQPYLRRLLSPECLLSSYYKTKQRWFSVPYHEGLIITAFSVVSSECSLVFASTDSTLCRDLCRYRDVELYRQYDAAFTNYQLSAEERTKLNGMRQDLLSNPQWSTTDARLASAELLLVVKMTCDLMTAALKLNPAASLSTRAVSSTRLLAADIVKDAVKGVKVIKAAVDEGAEASAYKQIVAEFNPLLSAIKALDDFKAGIDKMQQLGIDRDNLRIEVTRILDMVSVNIEKHNHIMKNNAMRLEDINQVVRGIDNFLLSHDCARFCTETQSVAKGNEENGPMPILPVRGPVEGVLGPGQVYVFFSLRLQDAYVLSRPIRATSLKDPLTDAKFAFVEAVEEQFPHISSNLKQRMMIEHYEGVKPNFAAPWSREPLLTPSAAENAMKAFVKDMYSSMADLPGPKPTFLYLK
jgi:hypothetical protein